MSLLAARLLAYCRSRPRWDWTIADVDIVIAARGPVLVSREYFDKVLAESGEILPEKITGIPIITDGVRQWPAPPTPIAQPAETAPAASASSGAPLPSNKSG